MDAELRTLLVRVADQQVEIITRLDRIEDWTRWHEHDHESARPRPPEVRARADSTPPPEGSGILE
jgi:hypothetical protein